MHSNPKAPTRVSIDQLDDFLLMQAVVSEDTGADADTVLAGRVPVKLLHTAVTDERSIQGGEIVTRADDGDSSNFLLPVGGYTARGGW